MFYSINLDINSLYVVYFVSYAIDKTIIIISYLISIFEHLKGLDLNDNIKKFKILKQLKNKIEINDPFFVVRSNNYFYN